MKMNSNTGFINKTGFGYIVIDGNKYNYDVIIHVNGKITRRRKELSKPYKSSLHTPFALPEIKGILEEKPEIVIIGTGQFGALPVMNNAIKKLEERGIKVIIDKTPRIIETINKLRSEGKRIVAILHVTC